MSSKFLLILLLIPLISAVLSYFLSNSSKFSSLSAFISSCLISSTFLISLVNLIPSLEFAESSGYKSLHFHISDWFLMGKYYAPLAVKFDRLSSIFTLVITGVGSLIHFFSIGYMSNDPGKGRFFMLLNFFIFFMLLLVLSDNMLGMFAGWEGVGICSYLLISFWFNEDKNCFAGFKAFIVNRIADVFLILAICFFLVNFGTLDFDVISQKIKFLDPKIIELVALFILIGAIGKSAQFPLHVWLPDAMAGPTPVSALIHAATMVTSGVYIISRFNVLFMNAPLVSLLILILGSITAILGAISAAAQYDLKKILAFSTLSQLGFMFMALGAGAYSTAVFHVVTHAFFKACLFLSAGSVIHAAHHEQDIRMLGGIYKKMPLTFLAYLAGALALAGFPYTSGFFSKDQIIWSVFSNPSLLQDKATLLYPYSFISNNVTLISKCTWAVAVLSAFLTAFYMTRSIVIGFLGSYKGHEEIKESSVLMTAPIIILATLSLFGGIYLSFFYDHLLQWTREDFSFGLDYISQMPSYHFVENLSIMNSFLGILLAVFLYVFVPKATEKLRYKFINLNQICFNSFYINELYRFMIISPFNFINRSLYYVIDKYVVEGSLESFANVIQESSHALKQMQGGRLQYYLLAFFSTLVIILIFLIY